MNDAPQVHPKRHSAFSIESQIRSGAAVPTAANNFGSLVQHTVFWPRFIPAYLRLELFSLEFTKN